MRSRAAKGCEQAGRRKERFAGFHIQWEAHGGQRGVTGLQTRGELHQGDLQSVAGEDPPGLRAGSSCRRPTVVRELHTAGGRWSQEGVGRLQGSATKTEEEVGAKSGSRQRGAPEESWASCKGSLVECKRGLSVAPAGRIRQWAA
ncbi:hypothetical protein GOP47_0012032 [Adiantum capillus-veneris]|uniref:Uncharacterized protein n=1 Tax=Adiantum capillus-veneris TaxID=13818 RepID=A0A9D4ZFZ0_ADICA|nr:hypothetical protein GOP47_0012032 [Adiantum capillus-veneris]